MKHSRLSNISILALTIAGVTGCGADKSIDPSPAHDTSIYDTTNSLVEEHEELVAIVPYTTHYTKSIFIGAQSNSSFLEATQSLPIYGDSLYSNGYTFSSAVDEYTLRLGDIEFGKVDNLMYLSVEDLLGGPQEKGSDAYWNRVLFLAALDYDSDLSNGIGFGDDEEDFYSLYSVNAMGVDINFDQAMSSFITDEDVHQYLDSVGKVLSNDIEGIQVLYRDLTETQVYSLEDCNDAQALLIEDATHQVIVPANRETTFRFCIQGVGEDLSTGVYIHDSGQFWSNPSDSENIGVSTNLYAFGNLIEGPGSVAGLVGSTYANGVDEDTDYSIVSSYGSSIDAQGNLIYQRIPEGVLYLEVTFINDLDRTFDAEVIYTTNQEFSNLWGVE